MNKDEFKQLLNEELTGFFGEMSGYIDKRFAEQDARLDVRLDRMQNTLDSLSRRQETDDQERVALSSQVVRHEGWIKQLAAKIGLRLSHD
jgi:hypothetical protein